MCICGQEEPGSRPTVKCRSCKSWSHKDCGPTLNESICYFCFPGPWDTPQGPSDIASSSTWGQSPDEQWNNLFQADQLPVAGSPRTPLASFISTSMSAGNNSGNASPTTGATNETRTSHPSPVSMAHSPNLDQNVLVAQESGNIGQGGNDPRPQLRVASSALQAAYRRIREVRRSLIKLDSRSSDPSNIGPEHSPLLFTESPVDEFSSDTDDPIDLQALRSNLAAVDRQSQKYLDRFAPGSGNDDHNQPPPGINPDGRYSEDLCPVCRRVACIKHSSD
ncbi:hypothetical protein FB45DRAFT_2893 [Roridomyces roridus]|uniref:Uncharacterized protein n=1 Tax=Roridomyces roridus TaxID=1738132 RepID=A0AAD7FYA6_9AGAR|nr:hypothetical protein FB45DRAFT_2893 [Roridomyces roridus]